MDVDRLLRQEIQISLQAEQKKWTMWALSLCKQLMPYQIALFMWTYGQIIKATYPDWKHISIEQELHKSAKKYVEIVFLSMSYNYVNCLIYSQLIQKLKKT